MVSEKDNKLYASTHEESNDPRERMLQGFKKRNHALANQVNSLRRQMPKKGQITLSKDGELRVNTYMNHEGKQYVNTDSVALGEPMKGLQPVLAQVIAITRASALGHDYRRHQQAHELGADGKPTTKLLRDANGKMINLPNSVDKLRAVCHILETNSNARAALESLSKVITESMEEINRKANEFANEKKSLSADHGIEI